MQKPTSFRRLVGGKGKWHAYTAIVNPERKMSSTSFMSLGIDTHRTCNMYIMKAESAEFIPTVSILNELSSLTMIAQIHTIYIRC